MPDTTVLEDFQWLVSEGAQPWLAETPDSADWLRTARRLRKDLSPARASLVTEQFELRQRAKRKFSHAESMFFTRVGLEQATEESIARYKAARFQADHECLDICCGIGGDLTALAARGPTVGVDRDPIAALFAAANARAIGGGGDARSEQVHVKSETADAVSVAGVACWHIDPDRRPQGRRTIRLSEHEPDDQWIEAARSANPNGAVKLAPAAVVPEHWPDEAELEWISTRGECRQLVAWFGALAEDSGRSKATVVTPDGAFSLRGKAGETVPSEVRLEKYLVEPDSAILAAGLDAALANELSLWRFDAKGAYLTGHAAVEHPLAECFEIVEILPLAIRPLKQALAARNIGRLEIKKRGVSIVPEQLRKKLALRGELPAVLIATPWAGRQVALLVERVARR